MSAPAMSAPAMSVPAISVPVSCVGVQKRPKKAKKADETRQINECLMKKNKVTCKTVYYVSRSKSVGTRVIFQNLHLLISCSKSKSFRGLNLQFHSMKIFTIFFSKINNEGKKGKIMYCR